MAIPAQKTWVNQFVLFLCIDFCTIVDIIIVNISTIVRRAFIRILIINGSPRTNGATGQTLSKIGETLAEMDATIEIEYIELGKMDLLFCKGCTLCYQTGNCHITEDGIENLSLKIAKAGGVVFGSPTYASNVSGHLKILIDRGHFVFEQLLRNKACFSVITYENFGGKKAQKVIKELIRFSGGAVSCKYWVKLNHGDKTLNHKRNKRIRKLCRKFLFKTGQTNPLSPYEKILRTIAFHIGIKPHAFKNKSRYEGVIHRWIEQGLITERG